MTSATLPAERLRVAAVELLRAHDRNGRTLAAADLYPHQWSWDAGFIAIGWARVDVDRAARELETLLDAQWSDGKIPHIVFNDSAPPDSYWPGPTHWSCEVPADAPSGCTPNTSGLLQPPVHAVAAARLWQVARTRGSLATDRARELLDTAFPRLLEWHAYLHSARDMEASGLVSIYHPWESGLDNSPRWDAPLAAVHPLSDRTPHTVRGRTLHTDEAVDRPDLEVVGDESQRPGEAAYRQYRWLVELLRRHCYDDREAHRAHPFLVKDVLSSGLLVAANEALLDIARLVGAEVATRRRLEGWIERGRRGLAEARHPRTGLARDYDMRARRWVSTHTVGGFAELVAGTARGRDLERLVHTLESAAFAGDVRLRRAVPPSTSPLEPGFDPRRYWRGPTWPVLTWLLWWAAGRAGRPDVAARLRQEGLDQLWDADGFPEYLEPFTGEVLGSARQSWTAAVALDWLDAGPPWHPGDGDGTRSRRGRAQAAT